MATGANDFTLDAVKPVFEILLGLLAQPTVGQRIQDIIFFFYMSGQQFSIGSGLAGEIQPGPVFPLVIPLTDSSMSLIRARPAW